MASVEKSVKGATKLKVRCACKGPSEPADNSPQLAPPKAKYISYILQATRTGEQGVAEIFRTLQFRLRDSTWTIAFKALIVVHMMIREGEQGVTLSYIATSPKKLVGVSQYTDGQWREVSYKPGPPWGSSGVHWPAPVMAVRCWGNRLTEWCSTNTGQEHTALLGLPHQARRSLPEGKMRLCRKWGWSATEALDRQGLITRDRSCTDSTHGFTQV